MKLPGVFVKLLKQPADISFYRYETAIVYKKKYSWAFKRKNNFSFQALHYNNNLVHIYFVKTFMGNQIYNKYSWMDFKRNIHISIDFVDILEVLFYKLKELVIPINIFFFGFISLIF